MQHQSILENIGKEERPRFFPPMEIRDICSASINDYDLIMCGNRERHIIRDRTDIFSDFPAISNEYIQTIQESSFLSSMDNCFEKHSWFPEWLEESQEIATDIPFSKFIYQWTCYLSFLTPGDEIGSSKPISELMIQEQIKTIYKAIHRIDFSDLFQNDLLYQGILSSLNVYNYSTSSETIVE